MVSSSIIGKRIRHFRKLAGLSQFDIETELNMSVGALSRIESGKTNPTKETLDRIADAIGLDFYTRSYVYGATASPASEEEIEAVKEYLHPFFNEPTTFSYVVDERDRLIDYSKNFKLMLEHEIPEEIAVLGTRSTMQMVLANPQLFPEDKYADFVRKQLFWYQSKTHFMFDDPTYVATVEEIKNHSIAKSIWKNLMEKDLANATSAEIRLVPFKVHGQYMPMRYVVDKIPGFSRFELRTYEVPEKLIELLKEIQY